MIQVTIKETTIIFARPSVNGLHKSVTRLLKGKWPRRVVFLDCAPSEGLLKALGWLRCNMPWSMRVVVRDHHDITEFMTEADVVTREFAKKVRAFDRVDAVVSNRAKHPACSQLIKAGEFAGPDVVIIADGDLDGITAAFKAVGVTYAELDADAAIFDGPSELKTAAGGVSSTGMLLLSALASVPIFDRADPKPHETAKVRVIEQFAAALGGDAAARAELDELGKAHEQAIARAREVASQAVEIVPGVWLASSMQVTERYDAPTLNVALVGKGALIIVTEHARGALAERHGSTQLEIRLTSEGSAIGLNLRALFQELTPGAPAESIQDGFICHVPFLGHVTKVYWDTRVLPYLQAAFNDPSPQRRG